MVGASLAGVFSGRTSRHAAAPAPLPSAIVALTRHIDCPPDPTAASEQLVAFHPVAAVTCNQETRQLPGQGEWLVSVRRVATGGVSALQAAFELPNDSVSDGFCDLVGYLALPIILVDAAGHAIVPTMPHDGCGRPLAAFGVALGHVAWHEVEVRPIRVVVTPAAQAAHCAQDFKNMSALSGPPSGGKHSPGGPIFATPPSTAHFCLYEATGSDLSVGTFDRGVVLSVSDTRKLLGALTGPRPGGHCPTQRQFVAITTDDGSWATVELGGCWRVAWSTSRSGFGSANASVVSSLLHLH